MAYYISKTVNKPFGVVIADVTARLKEQGFGPIQAVASRGQAQA
jgi:hypothetical protein